MTDLNTWADGSAIAVSMQEDAAFVIRETYQLQNLITQFSDMTGGNLRKNYIYNQAVATAITETDDLVSSAFTPAVHQTLTPGEIGLQFFVTDLRAESDLPENIITDGARELGLAAGDKIETDIYGDFASLTGGSVGTAGATASAPTWGLVAAAIAQARNANKSSGVPLACVLHGYHWSILAKSASIAGATVATAPGYIDEITRSGYVGSFMGVPLYQIYATTTGTGTGTAGTARAFGAVIPRNALAIDWRRPIRVRPQRDESLRGTEFNMSAVYAHGIWRPALGVSLTMAANVPDA